MRTRRFRQGALLGFRKNDVLTRLGLVSEADLVAAYAETLDLQVATIADAPAKTLLTADLPERFLRHARLLSIADTQDGVVLAMAHPDDALSLHAVRLKLRRPAHRRVAAASDVERMLDLLYAPQPEATPDGPATEHQADDAERLRDLASDAPIVRPSDRLGDRDHHAPSRWLTQAVRGGKPAARRGMDPQRTGKFSWQKVGFRTMLALCSLTWRSAPKIRSSPTTWRPARPRKGGSPGDPTVCLPHCAQATRAPKSRSTH